MNDLLILNSDQYLNLILTPQVTEWLMQEQWLDEQGQPETISAIVNRKLEKLMKLEEQGY